MDKTKAAQGDASAAAQELSADTSSLRRVMATVKLEDGGVSAVTADGVGGERPTEILG